MVSKDEKVVVAMSGGVDSSVAACLLVEQGYEVIGLFMRVGTPEPRAPLHGGDFALADSARAEARGSQAKAGGSPPRARRGCCSASDAADARFVAGMLGIPFYVLNFQDDFDRIIDYFSDEYVRGRTPNPCIVCNDQLKFGKIVDYANAVGAKYIATGHYARVATRDGRCVLMRGRDAAKDQSYVLFGLNRAILDRVMLPVGAMTKPEVRAAATRFGLPNCDKPDSVEICFVPDRDYARVVRARRPEAFLAGDVLDESNRVIGRHKGLGHYTIGQRRGLGIAAGTPVYVTELNVERNTVTLGGADGLLRRSLIADRANYLVDTAKLRTVRTADPTAAFRAVVKIRYLHRGAPATVYQYTGASEAPGQASQWAQVRVVFDEPQRAITPGQAVVFYDGDVVLGGAWISRAEGPG